MEVEIMGDSGLSAGDVLALAKDNEGFLEGNGIIILILFFLIFGFSGNGFGNNNATISGYVTQGDIVNGFNFNDLQNQVRGIQNGLCQVGYENLQNAFAIQSQLAQNGFNMQSCCCETNRNIDNVNFQNCQNTTEITNAIHCEGEQTRALITANVMQELRDQVTAYQNQLSNNTQTATLLAQLRPTPVPAYVTCSPYQAQTLAMGLYGNTCSGCNC
jgi:hypothetical protein